MPSSQCLQDPQVSSPDRYQREWLKWSDVKCGEHRLSEHSDVIVVDRAKYAGNIGSILRHMPLLGGVQVLFLTNSDHKRTSPYPVYTRGFLKEVMRVSMARNYQEFGSQLCVLEGGDGKEEMLDLLKLLKSAGFKRLLLENQEVFEELSASGRTLPCDSIFEQAVLQDFSAPILWCTAMLALSYQAGRDWVPRTVCPRIRSDTWHSRL
ncbi:unnamed protein product [Cladocopium goreaui]|uniref:tRNA/rRNA methyltransferase SpoU type domain-containing protein n=1 Tax=Cladocopium goreaui TaxID=2562237 RepID=A0A9P1CR70_9DINO|nr:unnamed protein product [Cladocopium goreaui]